jgi:hypothetical protein
VNVRILVCAATQPERDACNRGLLASGRPAHEMLMTGVGPVRAARSLARRLAGGLMPELIVSSGFAGALSRSLRLSSWISGACIGEFDGVTCRPVEGLALAEGPPGLVPCDVWSSSVALLGCAVDVSSPRPVAVDMESAALARVAASRGVPFAVVRMISDTPAHPLPELLSPLAAALSSTSARARLTFAGRALRSAIVSPLQTLRLVREGRAWLRELEDGWRHLAHWPL